MDMLPENAPYKGNTIFSSLLSLDEGREAEGKGSVQFQTNRVTLYK